MREVSTVIQSDQYVGNIITDDLLAINMRSHHNRTDPGSDFLQTLDHLDTNSIRFPGGTVTEEHFDPSDPNATRVENAVQVIHPHLIPSRSDVPIVRTVTPLSDYLTLVNELGGKPVVVLPTYRYFDQTTRTLTTGAEAEIRTFIRELMTDQYGSVEDLTLEIGNEFYQSRFNWTDAEFGALQAQIAEWIDDEVSSLGLRDDLTLLAQAGRNLAQNNDLASHFPGGADATVDGVILHFYGTSSVGDPLAMGRNISRELAETKQAWGPKLGADFEIAVTEWNVGESGESSTIVNGTMRSAPLLFMFAEMVRGGVDSSMIWAARTDGPGGLSVRSDPGSELSPTGYFYKMLSESVDGLHLVDPSANAYLRDASGSHVGYTYTFEGEDRSVTYFASGVAQSIQLSADMSQHIKDGAFVYARTLGVAPGDTVTDYWSEAALTSTTDLELREANGSHFFDVEIEPYQLIELHVVRGQGVEIHGNAEDGDVLSGSDYADFLDGKDGADKLFGKDGDDRLDGGLGADVLRGNQGSDSLFGGAGHDRLLGGEDADQLFGGRDKDKLYGHHGDDNLRGEQAQDELFGDLGNDVLLGGLGIDSLFGGADNDQLFGGVGADMLDGGNGDDVLTGMLGGDELFGGQGDDSLAGNNGNDALFGGAGADTLEGGRMKDTLTGGEGADMFLFGTGAGRDVITDFEDGVDAIGFMIQSFGYEDLNILQNGEDAVVRHAGGQIRITDVDVESLDSGDFIFGPLT